MSKKATRGIQILLVNQYYPPDTSATAEVFRDVVKALSGAGHEVTVVCGMPSYQPSMRHRWRLIRTDFDEGARIERVGSTSFNRKSMGGRAANYFSFFVIAAIWVLLRRRPDVVVVGSDPPIAVWIALLAARGRPVVYSLRDLHPDFTISAGMIRPGIVTRVWDAGHRAGLKRCALVICLGETMAERVRTKGVSAERIAVIPDGAPQSNGRPDRRVVAELRNGSRFVVAHAGNLGGAGAWETLIEAARHIDGGTSFLFVGDGFSSERIRQAGIRLVPFRPPGEIASVMSAGDLQVVSVRRGIEGLAVPSKLYTALAHGRPILAVAPEQSEVSKIVRRFGCGIVADPDDAQDVVAKVVWARSNPKELKQMSRRAKAAAREFEREKLLQRFVQLVEGVSARLLPHVSEGRGI